MRYFDIDWVAFYTIIGAAAAMTVLLTYFLVTITQRATASTPGRPIAKAEENSSSSRPSSEVSDEVPEERVPVLHGR